MNYFALSGAIIAGILALVSLSRIIKVYAFNGYWTGRGGFQINLLIVGVTAPLAAWLWTIATS